MISQLILFLFVCLVIRFLFVIVALYVSPDTVKLYMSPIAFVIGISFIVIYLFDLRKTGQEVIGKSKSIWWNNLRPVHGIMYLLFAIAGYHKMKFAWVFLLIDVILGILAHAVKYDKI
jgi:uncharacterized membrane protein YdcZ (DUF606 family)